MESNLRHRVSITRQPTDESSSSRPILSAETEASLRKIVAEQLTNALSDQEAAVAALRAAGDVGGVEQAQARSQVLARLMRKLETASPAALAALHAEVTALAAAAQAAPIMGGAAARAADPVQKAADAAREQVGAFVRDFYERKIFDDDLRFASKADEDAYRKREAERREAIDKALAKDTPQGALDANRLAIDQMHDAGAHGADKNPNYAPKLQGLQQSADGLATQVDQHAAPHVATASVPDPLDGTEAKGAVSPDLIAALKASGTVHRPDEVSGHGLAAGRQPTTQGAGRLA